ncbi:MAG: DUF1906 domain-containing protein [Actinobacteria bacterium]|nr:MAG: DUF1906 domain-containing protein [Actinomycetota bacterium]
MVFLIIVLIFSTSLAEKSVLGSLFPLVKPKKDDKLLSESQAKVKSAQAVTAAPLRPAVREGVDYSWGYYPGFAHKLKSGGKQFVMRYVATGEGKEITAGEVIELKKAGLAIGVVFEITHRHNRPLDGFKAGQVDATKVRQYVHGVGLPSNMPIYFAVDFEASSAQQAAINSYISGAASVLGKDKTGVYGGYDTVAGALNAGVCKYAWQTYSWSRGRFDARAQIRQYLNKQSLHGVAVDMNKIIHSDSGIHH